MKINRFNLLAAFAALLLPLGCQQPEPEKPEEKPADVTLTVTPASVSLPGRDGTAEVVITTTADWTATSGQEWLTVSPASGHGDATITLTAEEFLGKSLLRDGSVTVAAGELKKTIKVAQKSYETDFSGGEGTEASPYLIASAEDLASLSVRTNGSEAVKYAMAHYRQTMDISLAGVTFNPICQGNV
jgi:predicted component of type VI protein secretion system